MKSFLIICAADTLSLSPSSLSVSFSGRTIVRIVSSGSSFLTTSGLINAPLRLGSFFFVTSPFVNFIVSSLSKPFLSLPYFLLSLLALSFAARCVLPGFCSCFMLSKPDWLLSNFSRTLLPPFLLSLWPLLSRLSMLSRPSRFPCLPLLSRLSFLLSRLPSLLNGRRSPLFLLLFLSLEKPFL